MRQKWRKSKMNEVCSVITDGTHQTPKYFDSGYIFLSSKNVTSGKIDWKNVKYLDESQHQILSKRLKPQINDILLAKNGTTGVAAIVDIDAVFDIYVSLALLRPTPLISPYYLLHYINSPLAKRQFNKRLKGIGVPNLHLKEIREVEIPVPPLAEQEAIVAILDKAFAAIDQAKANIEQNIANAKELFQSKLNAIFAQKGDGWVEMALGEVTGGVLTGPFGSLLHKSDYIKNGIPLINPAHITETGIARDMNKTVTIETAQRLKNYKLTAGDIVIGRRGEMGRCAVVTENEAGWLCGTGSFIIKYSPRIEPEYLVRLLRSQKTRQELETIASGAVMKNLSNKTLSNYVIRVPPLESQQTALAQFNHLCSERGQLELIYRKKLTALDELKKSILQEAFDGELTSRDKFSTCTANA